MATFDKLIQDVSTRYHLGSKGGALVSEALNLIAERPGGILDVVARLKAAGLSEELASWASGRDAAPISGRLVEEALGADSISEIADRAGVTERFAKIVLGYAIPRIIGRLAQSGLLETAIGTAVRDADQATEFQPYELGDVGSDPAYRNIPASGASHPTFSQMAIPWAALLAVLGLFGYFAAIGGSRHATTSPVAVMAKTAPNLVQPAMLAKAHHAKTSPSSAVAPAETRGAQSMPARLTLRNDNGVISYSGAVANGETSAAITDALKKAFGADKISGDVMVDKNASAAGWTKYLGSALDNFKESGSQAYFKGDTINVGGTISEADRDRIMASLRSDLGPQFNVTAAKSADVKSGESEPVIAASSPKPSANVAKPAAAAQASTLRLPTIYFASNSAKIPSDGKADLERAAVEIKQLPPGMRVRINGFTDSAGNVAANVRLAQRRADAVRQALLKDGVGPSELSASGYGVYHSTAVQNEAVEGRSSGTINNGGQQGRRVELRVEGN